MNKHVNLLRKLAWSFHATTNLEYIDLFSEACLAYCEALPKVDTTQASEVTWIYQCVKNRLLTYTEREKRKHSYVDLEYANAMISSPSYLFEFTDQFQGDDKTIISIVLEDPRFFAMMTPKEARGKVASALKERGWTQRRVWKAIKSFKENLQDLQSV
jgi:DNA-directed RNA polymerase specialized sigma24 family protein